MTVHSWLQFWLQLAQFDLGSRSFAVVSKAGNSLLTRRFRTSADISEHRQVGLAVWREWQTPTCRRLQLWA
jgi:hypothetical protein